MTPDEIRAMEPGPELDALVAKAMGWVLGEFPQNGLMIEAWWERGRRIPDDPAVALRHERDGQEAFTPSSDIADAMRAVSIIQKKHDAAFGMFENTSVCRAYFQCITDVHTGYESEMWMLPMLWPDTFTPEPLPVVICKAILTLKAALLALREGELQKAKDHGCWEAELGYCSDCNDRIMDEVFSESFGDNPIIGHIYSEADIEEIKRAAREESRREALEEAAQVCAEEAAHLEQITFGASFRADGATRCEKRIRALAEKGKPDA